MKKIKIEAEVTHKKNVSSGIGKGFGLVIGIFLALLVIAVSCSIMIGKGAKVASKEIEKAAIEYEEEVIKPIEEEFEKIEEEMKEAQEELVGKEIEEVNKEDLFKDSIVKNTQSGITMSLDDFIIEDKGDWGKITNIKITILNEGSNTIFPKVNVMIWDDKSERENKYSTKETLELDGWIDNGNYNILDVPVNIAFMNLELEKTMKLSLVESLWQPKTLVAVEHKFKVKE